MNKTQGAKCCAKPDLIWVTRGNVSAFECNACGWKARDASGTQLPDVTGIKDGSRPEVEIDWLRRMPGGGYDAI